MISTERFSYNRMEKTFSCEMSDLNDLQPVWIRAYPDACDQGIRVVSHKTGEEAVFVLEREERDGEGDMKWWELKPRPEDVRKHPGLNGTKMVIFND